jgi:hypothetical protein
MLHPEDPANTTAPTSSSSALPSEISTAMQTPRADLPPDLANLTDEQISTLTQEITDSYTKNVPLVSPFLPISVLLEEFRDNEPFKRKIAGLAEKWEGFRRTARNGNCFYQAFAFAWIDALQRQGDSRVRQEIIKIEKTAEKLEAGGSPVPSFLFCPCFRLMWDAGFEKLAYEDFLETTLTILQSLPLNKSPTLAETLK